MITFVTYTQNCRSWLWPKRSFRLCRILFANYCWNILGPAPNCHSNILVKTDKQLFFYFLQPADYRTIWIILCSSFLRFLYSLYSSSLYVDYIAKYLTSWYRQTGKLADSQYFFDLLLTKCFAQNWLLDDASSTYCFILLFDQNHDWFYRFT